MRAGLGLGFAMLVVGCTSEAGPQQLPSASMTPHLAAQVAAVACGEDVAFDSDPSPDIRYAFTYDANGELTHASGAYAAGGSNDSIDYSYDAAGDFTGMAETNGYGGGNSAITATYDASSDLLDYTWSYASPTYNDAWDYAFSGFSGADPAREEVTEQGQPGYGYDLQYDASGRLTTAIGDAGDITTWTYDDAARTISVDTGSGAYTGVITYDADNNELSEVWGGADPSAIASSDVFTWSGDDMQSAVYSSGTTATPDVLTTFETDTVRYDCTSARTRAGERTTMLRGHHAAPRAGLRANRE